MRPAWTLWDLLRLPLGLIRNQEVAGSIPAWSTNSSTSCRRGARVGTGPGEVERPVGVPDLATADNDQEGLERGIPLQDLLSSWTKARLGSITVVPSSPLVTHCAGRRCYPSGIAGRP